MEHLETFDVIQDKYNYIIFDCDGVIWRGSEFIESTVITINKLLSLGKKLFFLSNTNTQSRQDLYEKLLKAGIHDKISPKNVYTSSYLISKHIKLTYPDLQKVYLIGMNGLQVELEKIGLSVKSSQDDNGKVFDSDEADKYPIDESLEAVVCGYDIHFNFYKMFYASQIIYRTNKFFGTNYDHKINVKGVYVPASYTIIAPLEICTERKAEIITKPDPRSINIILNDHGISSSELRSFLMVGDNMGTDILFANNAKIDSLLVFTGNTKEEDFFKLKETSGLSAVPTYTLKQF
jgi:4-nitrophenyl phosphatase